MQADSASKNQKIYLSSESKLAGANDASALSQSGGSSRNQHQMLKTESFGPLVQINDVASMQMNNVTMPGSWAIHANRFGFEPRVTQFSFNAIEKSKLNALEALKENGREREQITLLNSNQAAKPAMPDQKLEHSFSPSTPLTGHNHDLSDLSSFRTDCRAA